MGDINFNFSYENLCRRVEPAKVVPSAYDSIMMVAVSAVALIGLQLVIAEYPRRELDDGACGTEPLRD